MSIIVKGAEMPKTCLDCPLADVEQGWCDNDMVTIIDFNKLPVECPLVALPDKHGRLVDASALCEDLLKRWSVAEARKEELIKAVMADVVTPIIACQPTIVESEDES